MRGSTTAAAQAKLTGVDRRNLARGTQYWALALALAITLAHLLPWVAHRTAALTLSGNDLGFFTHFTPGAGIFRNEWFYLPLGAAAILLVLAARRESWPVRWAALILGAGLLALMLPRYQFLIALLGAVRAQGFITALRGFEFGLQGLLFGLFMVILLVLSFGPALKQAAERSALIILLELLCLGLCLVPLIGLLSAKPAIESLYQDRTALGWGWWLTLLAVFGLALSVSAKIKSAFRS